MGTGLLSEESPHQEKLSVRHCPDGALALEWLSWDGFSDSRYLSREIKVFNSSRIGLRPS